MRRVLRSGGVLGVLDFGMPRVPMLGALYRFYFMHVLPRIGKICSGVDGPYKYLPSSVRAFPPADELREIVRSAGFGNVEYKLLTVGIALLILARAD